MPERHVVEELATFLIAQNVVVDFNTPSATVPGVLIDPVDGAPAPRDGEPATVTLRDTMLNGPTGMGNEAWIEESFIDVLVRSRTAGGAKLIHRQIRGLLHPIGDLHGRKHWTMGGLLVEMSGVWRAEQPVEIATGQTTGTGARQERTGWARIASYRFDVRRSQLSTP